ncbi:Uncharacterised protein [Nocardia farcinica]|nr:Uncharacterised protein [Nocardia farcinica]
MALAYCRTRSLRPSVPWMRRFGARPLSEVLPAWSAALEGNSGTRTSAAPPSPLTSTSRTEPSARASTKAVCGKVVARSSGLMWKRSPTNTPADSRLGTR